MDDPRKPLSAARLQRLTDRYEVEIECQLVDRRARALRRPREVVRDALIVDVSVAGAGVAVEDEVPEWILEGSRLTLRVDDVVGEVTVAYVDRLLDGAIVGVTLSPSAAELIDLLHTEVAAVRGHDPELRDRWSSAR